VTPQLDLVTGAFGNTGAVIAQRLVARGHQVRTLTDHPQDSQPIDCWPFAFGDASRLAEAFAGVTTFYNTYWMRTGDRRGRYETAVDRCTQLIAAAEAAGVERIVHLSVIKATIDSPYAYFRGKAEVEARLAGSPVPAAIVRPSLIFGGDSVLLNNLAYLLRRAPVFAVAGDGAYRCRPVHIGDVADLCVAAGGQHDRVKVDAIGPERPTFLELITWLRTTIGSRARIVKLPPAAVLAAGRILGVFLRDQVLTRDELDSTMQGLADADGPATGSTRLTQWLIAHAAELGRTTSRRR
jgi:NADH dehydrogenase